MKPEIIIHPTFTLPRILFKKKVFNFLELDGFSCVHYKQLKLRERYNIFTTYYMCAVILSGQKTIYTDSGNHYLNPGDGFFAQKGSYLFSDGLSSDNKQFSSLIFFIKDHFLSDFLKKHAHLANGTSSPDSCPDIMKIEGSPLLKSTVESTLPYFSHETRHTKELLKLKADEILLHVIESDRTKYFLNFLKRIYSGRKKNLINLMEENFSQPLNVEEFARISGRSLTSFKKEFKTVFNESPKQWINRKRLKHAHSLLATTEKNVTQVCFDVGFENISYFTQLFKKHFGQTPKQLQKDQNQQKYAFS